jgi:hypothetical protein
VKSPISAVVAIGIGLVVLLGYFLDLPGLSDVRNYLIRCAVILIAVGAWIGVANLLSVHWKKVNSHHPDTPYSLVLVIAFTLTLILGIWDSLFRPANSIFQQTITSIQRPIETSLMAVLTISLAYASIRLLRRRRNALTVTFFVVTVIFQFLGSGLLSMIQFPVVPAVVAALERLPIAGARGILLGVALGSLTTGLRVLTGADRPYGG